MMIKLENVGGFFMLFYERYGTGEVLVLVRAFEFAGRVESKMENNYTVFEYANAIAKALTL